MLRITDNLVGDILLSVVLDLNFFFVYFISILQKVLQEKGYTNPRPCFGCYYESR